MLSDRIKSKMREKNIGNKALSEKSGVPLGTLNKIIYGETQDPSVNTIRDIADALGCTLDDFADTAAVKEDQLSYYIDGESAEKAQELMDKHRILMDATRKVSPKDLDKLIALAEMMAEEDD